MKQLASYLLLAWNTLLTLLLVVLVVNDVTNHLRGIYWDSPGTKIILLIDMTVVGLVLAISNMGLVRISRWRLRVFYLIPAIALATSMISPLIIVRP